MVRWLFIVLIVCIPMGEVVGQSVKPAIEFSIGPNTSWLTESGKYGSLKIGQHIGIRSKLELKGSWDVGTGISYNSKGYTRIIPLPSDQSNRWEVRSNRVISVHYIQVPFLMERPVYRWEEQNIYAFGGGYINFVFDDGDYFEEKVIEETEFGATLGVGSELVELSGMGIFTELAFSYDITNFSDPVTHDQYQSILLKFGVEL